MGNDFISFLNLSWVLVIKILFKQHFYYDSSLIWYFFKPTFLIYKPIFIFLFIYSLSLFYNFYKVYPLYFYSILSFFLSCETNFLFCLKLFYFYIWFIYIFFLFRIYIFFFLGISINFICTFILEPNSKFAFYIICISNIKQIIIYFELYQVEKWASLRLSFSKIKQRWFF